MPVSLVDNPASYPANVRAPADADAANGATFQMGHQDAADRTAWLKDLVTSSGIKVIKSVASSAALKALTGINHGEVTMIGVNGSPLLYRRNTAGVGADAGQFYFDHDTEAGGWDLVRPPNALFDYDEVTGVAVDGTSSSTYSAIPGTQLSVSNAKTGDLIRLTAMVQVYPNNDAIYLRARVVDGTPTTTDLTQTTVTTGVGAQTITYFARHDLAAGGTVTAELWHKNNDNATAVTSTVQCFRMDVYRQ